MDPIATILARARERAEQLKVSYAGALLPAEAHALLQADPSAKLVDVRRFGPGERIVFEPYTRDLYESTHKWVEERNIFPPEKSRACNYEDAVACAA